MIYYIVYNSILHTVIIFGPINSSSVAAVDVTKVHKIQYPTHIPLVVVIIAT